MENNSSAHHAAPQPPPAQSYRGGDRSGTGFWNTEGGRKSSALATMLSLVPGLGQVYVGYYQQGFINVLVVGSLITMLNQGVGSLVPLMVFFLIFYWLYNMVDAGRRASFYNLVLSRSDPDAMAIAPLPDDSASLLAGVALVFFGSLFLCHTLLGYSLEWLREWWPLGLVIVGIYLIYQSVRETDKSRKGSH